MGEHAPSKCFMAGRASLSSFAGATVFCVFYYYIYACGWCVCGSPQRKRKTAREMGSGLTSHHAIDELRKPLGAFNWYGPAAVLPCAVDGTCAAGCARLAVVWATPVTVSDRQREGWVLGAWVCVAQVLVQGQEG